MGIDGFWWFYKVEEADFSVVELEFNKAAEGIPSLPEVPPFTPRLKTPPIPVTQDYAASVLEGILIGRDLSSSLYHHAFGAIAYKIVKEEFPLALENVVEVVTQSRVLPPAILLVGIGRKRFSQLPGYLGNMLLHPSEIVKKLASVSRILDVEWEGYFERAKLILDYAGFEDDAARDVSEVLQVIPKALEKVKAEGAGLLAVTSWGCP
jgi:hypothetical protein